MTNNPEPPIFVYILQRINNKYDVITKNRDIPKETIMANLRAELKILEKEFLNDYKSSGN